MITSRDLEDQQIALTGRFTRSRTYLKARLEALGATVSKSVSPRTTFLIRGKNPGQVAYQQACSLGITILSEEQLLDVLEGVEVTPDEHISQRGKESLDDLLGEARSLVAKPASHEVWEELVELFDQCRIEENEPLTTYIHAHTDAWSTEHMRGLFGHAISRSQLTLAPNRRRDLKRFLVHGEVRVAPLPWLGEMLHRVDSPRYRLIRAVDLRHSQFSTKQTIEVLSHPALQTVERLYLKADQNIDSTLTQFLCAHPPLQHLDYFAPGQWIEPEMLEHLVNTSHFQLGTLDLTALRLPRNMVETLVKGTWLSPIHTLIVHPMRLLSTLLPEIVRYSCAPNLHTLVVAPGQFVHRIIPSLARTSILRQIRELTPGRPGYSAAYPGSWRDTLKQCLPQNIEALDFSQLHVQSRLVKTLEDDVVTYVISSLLEGHITRHLKHLKLGPWWEDPRVKTLAAKVRPELTITAY